MRGHDCQSLWKGISVFLLIAAKCGFPGRGPVDRLGFLIAYGYGLHLKIMARDKVLLETLLVSTLEFTIGTSPYN